MRTVFRNISELLTLSGAQAKGGRRVTEADLSPIAKAAMVEEKGRIVWTGAQKSLPREFSKNSKEINLEGEVVLPGFTECHTHALYAGTRSAEFEMRNQGMSYQEINARGGGIRSSMTATRQASSGVLKILLEQRIERFIEQGVVALEVKTGYSLDEKHELRCLKILNEKFRIPVIPTYLGAHSIPPEFQSAEDYLDFCAKNLLPKIKKLTRRIDIFIERGFFNFDSALDYLQTAKDLGFDLTVHADQLSLCGGADAARMMGAKSADHLLMLDEKSIQDLAKSEVTCVLLPAADLYMKVAYPKARAMIEAGCRVALATDFNPGTSPTQDLCLVGVLARLEMKMSLPEVIAAYTVGSAHALGAEKEFGSLDVGRRASFISMKKSWDELFYSVGERIPSRVYGSGRLLHRQ